MFNELLPVGSVVLLKNRIKKIMVIGLKTVRNGIIYDYIGVMYPEGFIGSEEGNYLFNHSDINDVLFWGYSNPERETYIEMLEQWAEQKEQKM